MASSRRATLLIVLAHPDDEVFHGGILAHLAMRGARVQLLTLTHGEAGKVHDPSYHVDDLGAVRAQELRVSCERLGIEPPLILDFHDSGRGARLRVDDARALVNVDASLVEAAIRGVVMDLEPHVIVTHDPHGAYDHPDHVATCRATTAAFYSSGRLGASAPERLFYGVIERETFRALANQAQGPLSGLDADIYGVDEPLIAVSFDARGYYERKMAALAAHRTQFGLTLETVDDPPPQAAPMLAAMRPVLERESFALGGARGPIRTWPLVDFFQGLAADGLSYEAGELAATR